MSLEANRGFMETQSTGLTAAQTRAGEVRPALARPASHFSIFIWGIRRVGEKRGGLVTTASPSFLVTYICGQFSTLYSIKGKRGTVLARG